jgi:hypothetical protein
MITKEIDNLSGLIDEEAACSILEKKLKTKAYLIDIDEDIERAVEHLKTHKKVWIRNSCGGNKHAIIFDHCKICENIGDQKYKGKVLFDNKGNLWAESLWHNPIDKTTITPFSTTLIHFISEIYDKEDNTLWHYYFTDMDSVRENIRQVFEVKPIKLYYTFHLAYEKSVENFWIEERQSKDKKTMEEFKVQYKMNTYFNLERLYGVYCDFTNYIPKGYNCKKLKILSRL